MSYCRTVQLEGGAYLPGDGAASFALSGSAFAQLDNAKESFSKLRERLRPGMG